MHKNKISKGIINQSICCALPFLHHNLVCIYVYLDFELTTKYPTIVIKLNLIKNVPFYHLKHKKIHKQIL